MTADRDGTSPLCRRYMSVILCCVCSFISLSSEAGAESLSPTGTFSWPTRACAGKMHHHRRWPPSWRGRRYVVATRSHGMQYRAPRTRGGVRMSARKAFSPASEICGAGLMTAGDRGVARMYSQKCCRLWHEAYHRARSGTRQRMRKPWRCGASWPLRGRSAEVSSPSAGLVPGVLRDM